MLFNSFLARILNTPEHNRVRIGGIRSGNKNTLRVIYVLIAARRRIHAQRGLVTRHGRGHAQARVGIHVIGADEPFGQLVENVIIFGQQLSGDIKCNRIRTMLLDDVGKFIHHAIQRHIPAHPLPFLVAPATQLRIQRAQFIPRRQVQGCALGA